VTLSRLATKMTDSLALIKSEIYKEFGDLVFGIRFNQWNSTLSVYHCLNTNIYSYSETTCGQSSYLYLNVGAKWEEAFSVHV
jgi:hypothetical protein